MIILANGIFGGLSIGARRKIAELQRHILIQERNYRRKWPEANRLIKETAEEITGSLSDQELPINLDIVARCLNVYIERCPKSASSSLGKLTPIPGGFELVIFGQICASNQQSYDLPLFDSLTHKDVDSKAEITAPLSSQGRFTFAHELGHVFFFTSDQPFSKPNRLIPRSLGTSSRRWREEGLCHDFARAILMPDRYKSIIKESGSIHELHDVTKAFNISKEPAVRRILYDWEKWRSCLVVNTNFAGAEVKVQCFRGADRKKYSDSNPTRTKITEWINVMKTPSEVATMFRKKFELSKDKFTFDKLSYWGIL